MQSFYSYPYYYSILLLTITSGHWNEVHRLTIHRRSFHSTRRIRRKWLVPSGAPKESGAVVWGLQWAPQDTRWRGHRWSDTSSRQYYGICSYAFIEVFCTFTWSESIGIDCSASDEVCITMIDLLYYVQGSDSCYTSRGTRQLSNHVYLKCSVTFTRECHEAGSCAPAWKYFLKYSREQSIPTTSCSFPQSLKQDPSIAWKPLLAEMDKVLRNRLRYLCKKHHHFLRGYHQARRCCWNKIMMLKGMITPPSLMTLNVLNLCRLSSCQRGDTTDNLCMCCCVLLLSWAWTSS